MNMMVKSLLGVVCFAAASSSHAVVTNFSQDVATSIDLGLASLDTRGAYNNPSSAGAAAGLTLLALLEKRVSADPNAVNQGYADATVADQGRMRNSVAYILSQIDATPFDLSYRDGGFLMALSLYLRTGGPDRGDHPDLPAALPHDLISAINTIVDRFGTYQRASGYWCYGLSFQTCDDSSTTQFVVAGLAAVKSVYSTAPWNDAVRLAAVDALLANARTGYVNNGTPGQASAPGGELSATERGHGYNVGNVNSLQQTASGTWIQLAGGANVNDPSVQGYLEWLRNRYGYSNGNANANGGWGSSGYYYMWSASKALQFIEDSGVTPSPGNLGASSLGTLPAADAPAFAPRQENLDPAAVARPALFGPEGAGYYADPEETPRTYFDFAFTLLNIQDADGQYTQFGQWNTYSRDAYAILVLERSVGGGCIDSDGDGVCDADDNCVEDPNPDQADGDQDGIGDVCDIPEVAVCDVNGDGVIDRTDLSLISRNRNQPASGPDDPMDADGDGMITVKDVKVCIPQQTPIILQTPG